MILIDSLFVNYIFRIIEILFSLTISKKSSLMSMTCLYLPNNRRSVLAFQAIVKNQY